MKCFLYKTSLFVVVWAGAQGQPTPTSVIRGQVFTAKAQSGNFASVNLKGSSRVTTTDETTDDKTKATLKGTVLTVDGQPVELVTIVLKDNITGRVRHATYTGADGRFTLKATPGRYVLGASVVGYAVVETPVNTGAGQTMELATITLSQTAR